MTAIHSSRQQAATASIHSAQLFPQANATDMTLDADGNIHVSGLPQGSYYWKETTTANGYALKTKTDVTVEADKTSKTVVDNQRTSVDKGELVIYKTDESGKSLQRSQV